MDKPSATQPVTIRLTGRIDSGNAAETEQQLQSELSGREGGPLILDAEKLEYISSAGLRIMLRLRKSNPLMKIINVAPEVYEIFDTTGFTEMMQVEKAMRVISVDDCEVIGRGAKGAIYRVDRDNVVKVNYQADALADIQRERESARLALILGIPTAIAYDVVKVGECYGSVFELLSARSMSQVLAEDPGKLDWCVREYVELLKRIHGTEVPPGKLPDFREQYRLYVDTALPALSPEAGAKLRTLVDAIPYDDHMLHGDYHTKNLMIQNDEVLLIDMDTLAVGCSIFEFGNIFNSLIGFYELDRESVLDFQGFDFEMSRAFWNKTLTAYLETEDPDAIRALEDKARILGYTRLISRALRHGLCRTEKEKAMLSNWTAELTELLARTDTLLPDK